MDNSAALSALGALAQPTRLEVFRLLMQHEPDGLLAGDIAKRLDVPHNTMSTHLAILSRAGLITAQKQSRTVTYRAELPVVRDLIVYLLRDCCGGKPELCAPLVRDLSLCCDTEGANCA
jgi:DNA-binding transcriptional ArsR family regulator